MKALSDKKSTTSPTVGNAPGGVLLVQPPSFSLDDNLMDDDSNDNLSNNNLISSLRSQRLSDTYSLRTQLVQQTKPTITRVYQTVISNLFIDPLVAFLFPRLRDNQLQNIPIMNFFFRPTTQVQLLCSWVCEDGHICKLPLGHPHKHECIFGHVEGEPILKCGHLCDCRFCEAPCVLKPGHSGTHACHFNHPLRDIPTNRREQESFRDEKAIGGYMSELAFISSEDMKYSHIPTTLNDEDENWWITK
ncbi:predicted protein [Naegleria gruberi]|uniref:Predicted protein n=1 Tax=Naegleria gruberi TaxID=5762 RepID=D2VGA1_NAEGR|nr:uncharacterized protein NAEGRDRAFT_67906 [Naegleria gruberi]EFC44314.1 predicted protein [Naegleria gruberi]|eukprot:XP_002677058.1 predicted protein [Naegleria gruberi strain NEG-M]